MTHLVIRLPYRHRRSLLGRFTVQPKRGPYSGRLAFDPDTEFHTDKQGRRVVTDEDGLSWRYARRADTSHNARYQRRPVVVDATANQDEPEPHHYAVQEGDRHYAPDGPRLVFHADGDGPTVTSHTDAWK